VRGCHPPYISAYRETDNVEFVITSIVFNAFDALCIATKPSVDFVVQLVRVGAKFCVVAGMFWNAGSLLCFG